MSLHQKSHALPFDNVLRQIIWISFKHGFLKIKECFILEIIKEDFNATVNILSCYMSVALGHKPPDAFDRAFKISNCATPSSK